MLGFPPAPGSSSRPLARSRQKRPDVPHHRFTSTGWRASVILTSVIVEAKVTRVLNKATSRNDTVTTHVERREARGSDGALAAGLELHQ